jgi:hypothetical protein
VEGVHVVVKEAVGVTVSADRFLGMDVNVSVGRGVCEGVGREGCAGRWVRVLDAVAVKIGMRVEVAVAVCVGVKVGVREGV